MAREIYDAYGNKRVLNYHPDLPDHRDRLYSELRPQSGLVKLLARPKHAYLHEDNLPRVYDQGNIGSCVGHGTEEAFAYAIDYVFSRYDGQKPADYSRLFQYYNARQQKDQDSGAFIRDGIKAAAKYGICKEELWPYDTAKWAVEPPKAAYDDAANRKAIEYYRIETIGDAIDCIAQGFPVVFGTVLFNSFMDTGSDGIMTMPGPHDSPAGGHCMLHVGYSLKKKAMYTRNSWGWTWGHFGHVWMPFDYLKQFSSDMWTIRRVQG
jgi:C1A family cysteine protease